MLVLAFKDDDRGRLLLNRLLFHQIYKLFKSYDSLHFGTNPLTFRRKEPHSLIKYCDRENLKFAAFEYKD